MSLIASASERRVTDALRSSAHGRRGADLEDIYTYVTEYDSRQKADYVLDRLLEVTERLATSPERGLQPRELSTLGIHEYRQVFFKPYRVIYRHTEGQVIIYLYRRKTRNAIATIAPPAWRLTSARRSRAPIANLPTLGRNIAGRGGRPLRSQIVTLKNWSPQRGPR